MAQFSTTIDNVSPLINYQPTGAWREGISGDDPEFNQYSNSTFTLCTTNGANATFKFNGSSVQIFGAKRDNHGLYNVSLDGTMIPSQSGFASHEPIFQTPLFSSTDLENGEHTVVIINAENNPPEIFLDIDFITWVSEIDSTSGGSVQIVDTPTDDTHPAFNYQPDGAWSTSPLDLGSYSGGTGHITSTFGAFVTYNFSGDGISLFGAVGPTNGPYSVQMDNDEILNYNATKENFVAQVMMYQGTNLGPGQHSLKIWNEPVGSDQSLAIDFAVVHTASDAGEPNPNPFPVSQPGQYNSRLSGGVIAGIVLGILATFAVGFGGFMLYRRWRSKKTRHEKRSVEPFPVPAPGTPPVYPLIGLSNIVRIPTVRSTSTQTKHQTGNTPISLTYEFASESDHTYGYPAAHNYGKWRE